MTPEAAISGGDVSNSAVIGGSSPAGSSPAPSATDSNSSANVTTNPPVQETAQNTDPDPLAGVPSIEEVGETVSKEAFLRLRGEYDKVAPRYKEIQPQFEAYQPIISRFEQPEQLQSVLGLHDALIGWERDAQGELVPSTMTGAETLAREYPQHADFLAADLLNMETVDPETGQRMPRIDLALQGIAKDPTERAKALRILGAVEPDSISPQWQASQEELDALISDPENGPTREELALQDEYKRVPFVKRQNLRVNDPEFIKEYLGDQKFKRETRERDERAQQQARVDHQSREQHVVREAQAAGEQHLGTLLTDALTTFHNSVVEQCNFIAPLDAQSPPQGMSAQDVAAMNTQIAESNKSEAAMITGLTIALVNEQTRPFVVPLLKQIGAIDDKMLSDMEAASGGLGNNARNYGELTYRGKLSGNGFKPDASITGLGNEAGRNLKLLVHFANQVKTKLMEKRSEFFSMKATDHNQTLNGVANTRPLAQGSAYDPTAATPQRPQGWESRQDIERQYGS